MDTRHDARPLPGMRVIDCNNHLLGTVEAVEHDHFVVGEGLFFTEPHRIPDSAIGEIQGSDLQLRITREDALHSSVDTHWSELPRYGEIVELPTPLDTRG